MNRPLKRWELARRAVRKLAWRRVYRKYGRRPRFTVKWDKPRLALIKAWDGKVREQRLDIEREDFCLNP